MNITKLAFQRLTLPFFLLISACGQSNTGAANYAQCLPSFTTETDFSVNDDELFASSTDQWIVGLKEPLLSPSGKTVRKMKVISSDYQIKKINQNLLKIEMAPTTNKVALIKSLRENYAVKYIEPDHLLVSMEVSSQFRADKQWGHENIGSPHAWKYSLGNSEVVVAVIDSGIDFNHPDLQHSQWVNAKEVINGKDDDGNGYIDDRYGWNFVNKNNNPEPAVNVKNDYHGTHVAGIVAGNTRDFVSGVAPHVKLMSLRFLNEKKSGYTSDAIKAIEYATKMGAKIINASFGSYRASRAMLEAIHKAQEQGILVVAAAGNLGQNNDNKPFYPASYSATNIVSVTASTKHDEWLSGINYGVKSVDLAAPGRSIYSTDQNNSYRSRSGSSMAAPFVSGVAALLLSINPNLSGEQLKTLLLDQANSFPRLRNRVVSGRRLDAAKSSEATYKSLKGERVPPTCDL